MKRKLYKNLLITSTSLLLTSSLYATQEYAQIHPVSDKKQNTTISNNSGGFVKNNSINNDFTHIKKPKNYSFNERSIHKTIDDTVVELSNRLLATSRIASDDYGELAITSFVDLNQLNKTTKFGRTLAESMFDELFGKGFHVEDIRGTNSITVNSEGEYFITRDINKLHKNIRNKYILVGTYSKFKSNILINARILDNQSGKVVASARSYYYSDDCKTLENCEYIKPRTLAIVTDNCSKEECGENGKRKPYYYNKYNKRRSSVELLDLSTRVNTPVLPDRQNRNVSIDFIK
ncbi:MAG: FlgO family outer membrane protein [Campylobacterota bacterium]|nr:FlgO family outer membrane protein [Campylobacterota bacterium]